MSTANDREVLRRTFERAAPLYHRARPDYPDELFDDLVREAKLPPGERLLEIGCATGKATLPLARRGFCLTGVELGTALAAQARHNLSRLDAEVVEGPFEDWQPAGGVRFGLVFAATAWQWIDPPCGTPGRGSCSDRPVISPFGTRNMLPC